MRHPIITLAAVVATCCAFSTSAVAAGKPADHIVAAYAKKYDVPVDFALAVARQETGGSGGQCGLRGRGGELGPLQILPSSARALGFKSLADCYAQTDAGMAHLAHCLHLMGGNRWAAATCHNYGFSAAKVRAANLPKRVRAYADRVMASLRGAS